MNVYEWAVFHHDRDWVWLHDQIDHGPFVNLIEIRFFWSWP